jgi:hypothetical protein
MDETRVEPILSGEDQRLMVRAVTRLTSIDEDTADALLRLKVRLQQLTRPTDPGEDKVEAVARAIAPRILYEFDLHTLDRAADWDAHSEKDRETMRLIAKDAIAAMGHTPPSGEDGELVEREQAAFMAGWLTRQSSDVQPMDAWAIYRESRTALQGIGGR